ncbi:MAG TPA: hypothetical protein PK024_03845 [Methanospirillum sp.]|uniref:hypothetical protein n=1 Tax=Methanospirillum sp. TaxID=45200 RepID=UPI002BE13A3C|nr:hypothetical protein [Methanospirillum sp.]HOJ95957.1 hypothetical protein [Methanospirillum sp.]HPP77686.1 hypothetical protein [Methanospirillum sp.]
MIDPNFKTSISKDQKEIAELLWNIGLKKNSALVLALMLQDIDLSSRDIELLTDLRQPEVSLAITDLMKYKWIDVIRYVREKKGRPVKIFHIVKKPDEILNELRDAMINEYERKIREIDSLKNYLRYEL